jgi:hypothetical protein
MTPQQVPQGTHNHCKNVRCYNRIQFIDTCSRCDGPTTPCRGGEDGCRE